VPCTNPRCGWYTDRAGEPRRFIRAQWGREEAEAELERQKKEKEQFKGRLDQEDDWRVKADKIDIDRMLLANPGVRTPTLPPAPTRGVGPNHEPRTLAWMHGR